MTYGEESGKATLNEETGKYEYKLSTGDVVTITPAAAAKITHVAEGEVDNAFTWSVANEDYYTKGEDTVGTLTVSPATLTIVTDSGEKEYDGTALTAGGKATFGEAETALEAGKDVTVALAGTETITVKITGSQTPVGNSENTYTITWGSVAESDYTVSPTVGKLTVTKSTTAITIVSGTNSWKYDGVDHSEPTYTVTYGTQSGTATKNDDGSYSFKLSTGDVITISNVKTVKNVGDTAANNNTFTYALTNADQYTTVSTTYGTLTITPRTVTMTSATDSKEYDGQPLTAKTVAETGDGFIEGEGATYNVTGSQTTVGNSPNTFTYTLNEGTLEENYTISTTNGTLTVSRTSKVLTIESASDSKMYDGTALHKAEYTVKYGDTVVTANEDGTFTLPTGDKLTITDTSNVVHVADTKANNNTFTYVLVNADQYETVTPTYGTLTITVRTITMTSATDSKVYDGTALTNDTVTVTGDGFIEGEGATYTVTGSQTVAGSSPNTFTYALNEGTTATDYNITTANGTLTVTQKTLTITADSDTKVYDGTALTKNSYTNTALATGDSIESVTVTGSQTVVGKSENVPSAAKIVNAAGEDVTESYQITYANGELEVTARHVTVSVAEAPSVAYDGKEHTGIEEYVFTNVAADQTATITYTPAKGTLVGTYTGSYTDGTFKVVDKDGNDVTDNYVLDEKTPGTLTITDKPVSGDLVVTKTAEDKEYALGEEVTFTIEVTNIYNEAKTITLEEIEGVTLEQSEFEDVEPGETVSTTATYTITEADIVKGSFTNTVTASIGDLSWTADATIETEEADPHLTVVKTTTSKPENGETYALGETITYEIVVTNDGNLTISNVVVTDELTGDEWKVDSLAPGESETFKAEYEVTEADIVAGSVVNEATADGDNESDKDTEDEPGTAEDPTEDPNPHMTVEKTTTSEPENGETYALGETIKYEITVTNDGNLTISDVVVTDELTGDEWTIKSLAPGASETFEAEYVVTEEDILAGKVVNEATADGDNESDEPTDSDPGTKEDPTEDPKPHLTVEKETTSKPADGEAYKATEVVTYKITVTNDGNLTITDIVVTDELVNKEWTIDSLAPGESKEFTVEYTVTEEDAYAGSVVNVATATGDNKSDDPTEDEPGTKEVPTQEGDVIYRFTEGDGQTWWTDSEEGAKFTVKRTPYDEVCFDHFLNIYIDGKLVDKSLYTAERGSTKLDVSKEFMDTLALGDHIIVAEYNDGKAQASFTVATKDIPDTGDHAEPRLYVSMLCLSMAGCLVLLTGKKRRKEEE